MLQQQQQQPPQAQAPQQPAGQQQTNQQLRHLLLNQQQVTIDGFTWHALSRNGITLSFPQIHYCHKYHHRHSLLARYYT